MGIEESGCSDECGLELGLSLGSKNTKLGLGFCSESSSESSTQISHHLTNTAAGNQVVGWPPVRAYRMNSMNQFKYTANEEFQSLVEKCKSKNEDIDMNSVEGEKNYTVNEEGLKKKSILVKVYKDGNGIGRKVDLNAHSCYESLAQTMEEMFCIPGTRRSSTKERNLMIEAMGFSKLLDGSSDFVFTYEDKDGDWMLVGDVPWGMFVNSVKRLRIMRTCEASDIDSKFQVRSAR